MRKPPTGSAKVPNGELYELTAKQPEMLDRVVAKQIAGLETEIGELKSEPE